MQIARLGTFFLSFITLCTTVNASDGVAVSPSAYKLFNVFGIPVTNSMIMSWMVSIAVVIGVRLAIGSKPSIIPTRSQAFIEALVEGVKTLITPIVGKRMVEHTFPLLVGLFFYILINNICGVLPGVGTIGRVEHGHLLYYFRPATADLNATLALAIVAMSSWLYFVLRYAGMGALMHDLFGNKADKKSLSKAIYYPLFFVFFAVGLVEVISILLRPLSLSLRLYGNMFGGETLLTNMTGLIAYIAPVPFYFLEILVGFVQALVFTLLVAVYIGAICNHGDQHSHTH